MNRPPVLAVPGLASVLVHGALAALLLSVAAPAQRRRSVPLHFEVRSAGSRPQPRAQAEAPVAPAEAPAPQPAPRRSPVRALPRQGRALAPPAAPAGELPVPPRAAAPTDAAPPEGPAPTSAPAPAPPPSPRPAGGQGTDLAGYLGRITQAVAARRHYPPMALELQLEGDVLVLATIKRDGTLARAPGLLRSSGHALLDAEALRMVSAAVPLPPLPADHPGTTAELRIPVRFRLED